MTTRHLPPGKCSLLLECADCSFAKPALQQGTVKGLSRLRLRPVSPEVDSKTAANMSTVVPARKTRPSASTRSGFYTTNRSRCGTDGVTSGPAAPRYTL